MALRLKRHEPAGTGLKRIISRRMDNALCAARQRIPSDDAVHDVRVNLKKLRADLRLLRTALGEKRYLQENRRCRDASRPLTEVRDAQILVETLDKLTHQHVSAIRTTLQQRYLATRQRVLQRQGALRNVVTMLSDARHAPWPVKDLEGAALIDRLGHTYRKARRACTAVREQPSIAHLHEWRKQSKYLWYQLLLLKAAWPARVKKWNTQFDTLTGLLGDDHDLAVLHRTLSHGHFAKHDIHALLPLIDARRKVLQKEALALGTKLYRDTPADFLRPIRKHWKRWHP